MQTGKALEDTKRIAHHSSYRVHLSSGGGTIYVDTFKLVPSILNVTHNQSHRILNNTPCYTVLQY